MSLNSEQDQAVRYGRDRLSGLQADLRAAAAADPEVAKASALLDQARAILNAVCARE